MKIKLLIIAVFILIFTIISFGQDNKTTKLGKNDNTKKIIKPASKIPSKPLSKISLVFLDLVNETSRGDYKYLSENIPNITKNAFLRKRNYPIVPTEKTQDVINDKNIKPNELNNAEKALEIGKTVKADMVIFGKYKVTNGNINISLKVVDTRDGKYL
ncbi:MAG: hypothetical protein OEV44_08470 [Spirochaetota bacterium]|nr:hypothetical protein [Spirochaetota bacterium]